MTTADDVDVVDATPKAQQRRHFRFVAPAVEFSNALKAVHPIAVPGDTAAQFDSIRIDVREDSTVTVAAANPMMMGAAEVPGVDVIASGSVDVAPRVAKELAEVAIQKVTNSGPVEVEVAASADFIEIALVYGLPFEPHKTRRPVQSPRQPLEGVAKHVSEVLQEVHAKERSSAMVSQSGVLTRATPAQEVALQKAARAIGAVVTRFLRRPKRSLWPRLRSSRSCGSVIRTGRILRSLTRRSWTASTSSRTPGRLLRDVLLSRGRWEDCRSHDAPGEEDGK